MSLNSQIHYYSPEDRITDFLLAQYRQELSQLSQQGILGKTLWLAPTQRIADQNRLALLDKNVQTCFLPQIYTFAGFAETILQQSGWKSQALSDVNRRVLLKLIIQGLFNDGKLKYFYPIAHTTGFVDIVGNFISELKRDETWPEAFLNACEHKGSSAKDHELGLIYDEYQKQLNKLEVYDAEGRFWLARENLKKGLNKHFSGLELIIVNGFTDFTFTQYEILGYLGENTKRIEFTLPREAELVRNDLFGNVIKTETRIRKIPDFENVTSIHFKQNPDTVDFRNDGTRPAGIQAVSDSLFTNPRKIQQKIDSDGIQIYHTTGQSGEVELLASQVKQLITDGVSPDEIIISYRSVSQHADMIQDIFRSAGIPVWVEAGKSIARSPVIRALLQLLQLEMEDWDFDLLLAVLNSNYFCPDWEEWNEAIPVAVSQILRKRKLSEHRLTILNSLERSVEYFHNNETVNGLPEDLNLAYRFLKRLDKELEPLRKTMGFPKWIHALLTLADSTGIEQVSLVESENPLVKKLDRLDKQNWDLFKRVFSDIGIFQKKILPKEETFELVELYSELTDLLNSHVVPSDHNEKGKVRVLDAVQVRSFEVPYLILAGLDENSFPNYRRDDCLYNNTERFDFTEQGVILGHRESRAQEEMLLFYNATTSATKRLSLSYPAIGTSGQPLYPSPYLTAINDLFTPESLNVVQDGHLDPVKNSERLINLSDFRLQSASKLLKESDGSLFKTFIAEKENLPAAINLRAAVIMAAHRYQIAGLTKYEGVIEKAELKNLVNEHFNSQYQFSTTQLEKYGLCPYQFYMDSFLGIKSQDSPTSATDHLSRGNLVHEVLAKLHELLPHLAKTFSSSGEFDQSVLDEVTSHFLTLSEELLSQQRAETKLHQAFIHLEKKLVQDWSFEYSNQLNQYYHQASEISGKSFETKYMEVPFGKFENVKDEGVESKSCLVLGEGELLTNIRGKIDRIDISHDEGQTIFNVVDYKSGGAPDATAKDFQSGRALQLPLYALAAQRILFENENAEPGQIGFWSLKNDGYQKKYIKKRNAKFISQDEWREIVSELEEIIIRLAIGIRNARFDVAGSKTDCSRFCDYRRICRIHEIRSQPDSLQKTGRIDEDPTRR